MDKRYIELFKELSKATAIAAEQVMDYDKSKEDEKGLETATIMRDDFQELSDRIEEAKDKYVPNQADLAKLLVGAMILSNNLKDKIAALRKAVSGYEQDLIPKLKEIVETATTDEEAQTMANEKFIIQE